MVQVMVRWCYGELVNFNGLPWWSGDGPMILRWWSRKNWWMAMMVRSVGDCLYDFYGWPWWLDDGRDATVIVSRKWWWPWWIYGGPMILWWWSHENHGWPCLWWSDDFTVKLSWFLLMVMNYHDGPMMVRWFYEIIDGPMIVIGHLWLSSDHR